MKKIKSKAIVISIASVMLSACGGGSSSGGGESLVEEREALECLSFPNGMVMNSCDFPIVARTFGGSSTPVTVPPNSSVPDPDANIAGFAGACRAPFTPVSSDEMNFECL